MGPPCFIRGSLKEFRKAIWKTTGQAGWLTTRGAIFYTPEELREVFNIFHDNAHPSTADEETTNAYWNWLGNRDRAPGKKGGQQADKVTFNVWHTGCTENDKDRIEGFRADGYMEENDMMLYKHFLSYDRFGACFKWQPDGEIPA